MYFIIVLQLFKKTFLNFPYHPPIIINNCNPAVQTSPFSNVSIHNAVSTYVPLVLRITEITDLSWRYVSQLIFP